MAILSITLARRRVSHSIFGWQFSPQTRLTAFGRENVFTMILWLVHISLPCADNCTEGATNRDAVWHYEQPLDGAQAVKDRIALWKGVIVVP